MKKSKKMGSFLIFEWIVGIGEKKGVIFEMGLAGDGG